MAKGPYDSALILGLAASGEAAARLLLAENTKVQIVDENRNDEILRRIAPLGRLGAKISIGAAAIPPGDYDVCVISPGLKPASPLFQEAQRRGIPVLPEFELGWLRAKCPVLAITGSNGKSTLVKLCVAALRQAGLKALAAGNYGPPVSQVVREQPAADWLVIEVSSFQLEHALAFHPPVAVLLNIFPNHLDRHHDLRNYTAIKAKIFARLTGADAAIVPDNNLSEIAALRGGRLAWRSFGLAPAADYRFAGASVVARASGQKLSLAGTIFNNEILGQTAAAALAALEACGVSAEWLVKAMREFQPLPHRLEAIGVINGIKFIDDSKATNAAALGAALKIVPAKIRLIAGGLPKNEPYEILGPRLAEKAAGVYLIGQAAEEMYAEWRKFAPCQLCGTLKKALAEAWRQASAGDTILLSPACASFDQFRNFEERGAHFRALFQTIKKGADGFREADNGH